MHSTLSTLHFPTVRLFASAKSWIEGEALRQLYATSTLDGIRLTVGFPDLHPGKGSPVGAAFVTGGLIYPYLIGGDIGCGMALFKTDLVQRDIKLNRWASLRFDLEHPWEGNVSEVLAAAELESTEFDEALGTIGGGNHFAELQRVEEVLDATAFKRFGLGKQQLVVLVHSGSRGLGESILRAYVDEHQANGSDAESFAAAAYLKDHDIAVRWAKTNRALIARRFVEAIGAEAECLWDGCHNSITWRENAGDAVWVHRKGVEISDSGRAPKNDPAIFALMPKFIEAFERVRRSTNVIEVVKLIDEFDLPREAIPTQWLNEVSVWEALLANMPMTAMIRNLGKMTSIGLVQPFSEAAKLVVRKLSDETVLKRARIHPLPVLIAEKVYAQGRGDKGSLTWKPVPQIIDALDEAFYATFQNVELCGKPMLLALDVSGSMGGGSVAGSCLTPREASAAMALVTAATEREYHIMGFSSRFMPLNITPRMRLDDVVKRISNLPFEGTDCALPMIWARENEVSVSAFTTYTDSETWAGKIHPSQALRQYRNEFVSDAKAVVVGMTSNGFTIADPNDRGMLDVVGFDTTAPAVIADFVRN